MLSPPQGGILALALAAATACGGKASFDAAQGGSGATGGATTAGTGNTAAEDVFAVDDTFPWFDSGGLAEFPSGREDVILHISARATPARATLSTHNIIDFLSYSEAVQFSARASQPFRLLVSASHAIQAYDYFAARDAGMQWPLAAVEVGVDWDDFSVPLTDMQPPEMFVDTGMPTFFLAFIVEHPEPVEVWLDKVQFKFLVEP